MNNKDIIAEKLVTETQIEFGTVTLSVEEAAPRLGMRGEHGVEKLRAMCRAKTVPSFHDGKSYRLHWPSVVAKLFGGQQA